MQRIKRHTTKIPSASAAAAASRSSKSVNNNEISCSANSTATVRKPLSDLSNFNLIPTDTLRKLVSSNSVSNSETHSLLLKSQTSIFPISQIPLISGSHKHNGNPKSDTRSGTSVGSSNFGNDPKTKPQNPTPVRHQLPPRSSTNPSDEGSELVIYSRRRGERKHNALPKTSTPFEKKKNEEKAASVPLSSTPAEKAKNKGKAIAMPFDSIAAEKSKDQGKLVTVPVDSIPAGNSRDKEKGISASFRPSNVEKTRDKGKDFYAPSNSTPVEKMRDKGKAIAVPVNCTLEEMEDRRRSTAVLINSEQLTKQREKRLADAMVQSCPPLLKSGKFGNELNQAGDDMLSKSWTGLQGKHKKRKCPGKQSASEGSLSPEFVKKMKAYFEEVDAFELPVEEVSDHDLE
ncbi:uncharacterized protein [Coffea arabica]|uniref:Sororin C-terminal region domain-containing protein n=1 Tax=Coffea arabica TaxID=13443 RepID=A0A6P6VNX3_COFAR|nr:uncharacterized protein LOC113725304 [Coffea arabica]